MSEKTFDNTNRGALFKNEDKQQDNHADYNGSINVNGQEYWPNAWLKTSKAGKKFMSLSVKPKMAREHQGAPKNPPVPKRDDFDDELPPF